MPRQRPDLRAVPAPTVGLEEVARRANLSRAELEGIFRREALEPTYSIDEVAQRFGCTAWQISQLVQLGKRYGLQLHPTRGGLCPTYKVSHKCRRIPLSAIHRHEQHMGRVHDGTDLRRSA